MVRQFDMFTEARGPVAAARQFHRQPQIDRGGAAVYVHLIRAPDDPERAPRPKTGVKRDTSPHLTLCRTTTMDGWRARILAHLADGEARTFNRIGVELCGLTADVLHSTPADPALWALVDSGEVEMTLEAPILFRKASP